MNNIIVCGREGWDVSHISKPMTLQTYNCPSKPHPLCISYWYRAFTERILRTFFWPGSRPEATNSSNLGNTISQDRTGQDKAQRDTSLELEQKVSFYKTESVSFKVNLYQIILYQ